MFSNDGIQEKTGINKKQKSFKKKSEIGVDIQK